MLKPTDLKVIFEVNTSKKYVRDVPGIDALCLTEVTPFIGIARNQNHTVERGIGARTLARILFFQPTQLKHPLQYWHALQIMERLWWLDRKFFKEAIAAGEQVYEKFTLSIPCRENLAELFQESRAAALREHLDPIIQTKIHREFLADSALRPENLDFSSRKDGGRVHTVTSLL